VHLLPVRDHALGKPPFLRVHGSGSLSRYRHRALNSPGNARPTSDTIYDLHSPPYHASRPLHHTLRVRRPCPWTRARPPRTYNTHAEPRHTPPPRAVPAGQHKTARLGAHDGARSAAPRRPAPAGFLCGGQYNKVHPHKVVSGITQCGGPRSASTTAPPARHDPRRLGDPLSTLPGWSLPCPAKRICKSSPTRQSGHEPHNRAGDRDLATGKRAAGPASPAPRRRHHRPHLTSVAAC